MEQNVVKKIKGGGGNTLVNISRCVTDFTICNLVRNKGQSDSYSKEFITRKNKNIHMFVFMNAFGKRNLDP